MSWQEKGGQWKDRKKCEWKKANEIKKIEGIKRLQERYGHKSTHSFVHFSNDECSTYLQYKKQSNKDPGMPKDLQERRACCVEWMVCDIFGRDWSPSANGRRIYQIVCYKMIPNYYPFSINFIFSTYYPIKHSKYTHPGGVWLAKKATAGASCVVEKTLKDTYFARLCT